MESKDEEGLYEDTLKDHYLAFSLGDELFGLPLEQVREIIAYRNITSLPLMPAYLRGIRDLRGHVLPVIDLSVRLGRDALMLSKRSSIVVCEVPHGEHSELLGLLVESVRDVVLLPEGCLEAAPAFGVELHHDFIAGIGRLADEFIIVLDASRTLSLAELAELARQSVTASPTPSGVEHA